MKTTIARPAQRGLAAHISTVEITRNTYIFMEEVVVAPDKLGLSGRVVEVRPMTERQLIADLAAAATPAATVREAIDNINAAFGKPNLLITNHKNHKNAAGLKRLPILQTDDRFAIVCDTEQMTIVRNGNRVALVVYRPHAVQIVTTDRGGAENL